MSSVVIIGGGIAGLSGAAALARRGHRVLLLEQGALLASASSSRSAAMFRLAVSEPINVWLARRSLELGQSIAPGFVKAIGGLYLCGSEQEREAILDASSGAGVVPGSTRPTWLADGSAPAVWSPQDGVIDVERLVAALVADARAHGAEIRCSTTVERVESAGGRVVGVIVGGEFIAADCVVDAAGAWSESLSGAPLGSGQILNRRRHMFVLESAVAVDCIAWDLGRGIYVRPSAEGIWACACDESEAPLAADAPIDPKVESVLREKLRDWAPSIAMAPIRRQWAGFRPTTPDHRFIVGPDPSLPGLFRLTGFGGHGMTAGLAAGELAARMISGELPEEARALSPSRSSLRGGSAH